MLDCVAAAHRGKSHPAGLFGAHAGPPLVACGKLGKALQFLVEFLFHLLPVKQGSESGDEVIKPGHESHSSGHKWKAEPRSRFENARNGCNLLAPLLLLRLKSFLSLRGQLVILCAAV